MGDKFHSLALAKRFVELVKLLNFGERNDSRLFSTPHSRQTVSIHAFIGKADVLFETAERRSTVGSTNESPNQIGYRPTPPADLALLSGRLTRIGQFLLTVLYRAFCCGLQAGENLQF